MKTSVEIDKKICNKPNKLKIQPMWSYRKSKLVDKQAVGAIARVTDSELRSVQRYVVCSNPDFGHSILISGGFLVPLHVSCIVCQLNCLHIIGQ